LKRLKGLKRLKELKRLKGLKRVRGMKRLIKGVHTVVVCPLVPTSHLIHFGMA